eukprot:jgi/Mesvir1/1188/Mv17682-RA.2
MWGALVVTYLLLCRREKPTDDYLVIGVCMRACAPATVKCGFPPRPFPPPSATGDSPLSELPLADGDTLVVAYEQTPAVQPTSTAAPVARAAPAPAVTPPSASAAAEAPTTTTSSGVTPQVPDARVSPHMVGMDHSSVADTEEDMLEHAMLLSLQAMDKATPGTMPAGGATPSHAPSLAAAATAPVGSTAQVTAAREASQGGAAVRPAWAAGAAATAPTPAPVSSPPAPCTYGNSDIAGGGHSRARGGFNTQFNSGGMGGVTAVRKEIASDNSCLFRAVAFVMDHREELAPQLRSVVADAVLADPFRFSEGVLGKPGSEYADWIRRPNSWGGGIELAILSEHYGREIAAYDVVTCRCDLYGQGSGYRERVFLMYDGIHYDALGLSLFEGSPDDALVTVFDVSPQGGSAGVMLADAEVNADQMSEMALALVTEAHHKKQFTDVGRFTLRCGVCRAGVKGQKEAVEHARATGHGSFEEYR